MNSLDKTFEILEYVFLQCGRPITPSEAAQKIGINTVTCTRILGELTERGYLDKISRKSGYAPGPMITTLATRDNSYKRLAAAASEPVKQLAERIRMPVNLAVMNFDRRIMLNYHSPERGWKVWNRFTFGDDHAETATGKLLLAALSPEDAEKIIQAKNLPFSMRELSQARRNGYVDFMTTDGIQVMGQLIRVEDYPSAAIGFGIRKEDDPAEILRFSKEIALQIERNLIPDTRSY